MSFTPATPADMPHITEALKAAHMDLENLSHEQFIVLREDGRIVAFGRIKPYPATDSWSEGYELGSVYVAEDRRGRGLGEAVTRELIRRFPTDEVYLTTDIGPYYERIGWVRSEILPGPLADKIRRYVRTDRGPVVGMVYDRRIEQLPTISDIYRAKHLLEPHLAQTPLVHMPALDRELGFEAHLKLESLQPIGAFKVRGGVTLCAGLRDEERRRGIIGASTGNHGQSLAYGARLFGVRCVIAMPEEANPMKVESMRALGAEVAFNGANFEEARTWAEAEAEREGMRYVHHINTPELVAGVATIGVEILEDIPDVDTVIVPIGGGSGAVGHCIATRALRPDVEVIGVQAAAAPAVYHSWRERTIQEAPIETSAEGLATGRAYHLAVRTFIDHLSDMVLVTEQEVQNAVLLLARTAHIIAEESGAASTAAAVQLADQLRDKKVAIIVSGGNMTTDTLRQHLMP